MVLAVIRVGPPSKENKKKEKPPRVPPPRGCQCSKTRYPFFLERHRFHLIAEVRAQRVEDRRSMAVKPGTRGAFYFGDERGWLWPVRRRPSNRAPARRLQRVLGLCLVTNGLPAASPTTSSARPSFWKSSAPCADSRCGRKHCARLPWLPVAMPIAAGRRWPVGQASPSGRRGAAKRHRRDRPDAVGSDPLSSTKSVARYRKAVGDSA